MKEKIIEKLGSHVSVVNIDKSYKDIGDMPDEKILKIDKQFDDKIRGLLI